MKFSEIDFDFVSKYLVGINDEDEFEVEVYMEDAKSFVRTYTGLTEEELDENQYFVMPTLMLISHFYENKTVELQGKNTRIYDSILNLGKVHSL